MNTVLKRSVIYVVCIVVVLMLIAAYFFVRMDQSLRTGQESDNQLRSENNALRGRADTLTRQVDHYETRIAELERDIEQQRNALSLVRAKQSQAAGQAHCTNEEHANRDAALQAQLAQSETQKRACELALQEKREASHHTANDAPLNPTTEAEQPLADTTLQALRSALDKLKQDNARLQQSSRQYSAASEALQQQQVASQQLTSRLSKANAQIAELQARLGQLQSDNQALEAATQHSNRLEIVTFTATPSFCDTEFAGDNVCLSSITIETTFNFRPDGFVAMRINDPRGETLGRESIAGRTVSKVVLELDDKQPALTGEYTVEFRVNDVFNRFSDTQRFLVVGP